MQNNQSFIDLRSDTVTRAPQAMLQAMKNAQIKNNISVENVDDVACTAFEQQISKMFGKQSAIFFPTATMANLAAVMLHTHPGSEIVISSTSHAVERQSASYALFAGVQTRQIISETGLFTAQQVKKRIRKESSHVTYPNTDLVFIQNATFRGRTWRIDDLREIKKVAESLNLKVHVDGTRIFNFLAHQKLQPHQIFDSYDTITVCLSKGLACPIGACVIGSKAETTKLRNIRKALGGGLWHPGLLTAAGIYSLEHILPQIPKDNQMAKLLASSLAKIEGISVNLQETDINMVFWSPKSSSFDHKIFLNYLLEKKIKIKPFDEDYQNYRFVTHYNIREKEIESVIKFIRQYFQRIASN